MLLLLLKIVVEIVFATKTNKQKKFFGLNSRGHVYIYAYKIK